MGMYKKHDFSVQATRAACWHEDPKNGELGFTVWFGTKSKRSASRKAQDLMRAIYGLKLKKFPEVKTKNGQL